MSNERTVMFQLPTMVSGSLACVAGSVAGRTWPLSAGTFVIGRQPGCDLHLPVEPGVSKVHAKIVAEGDSYVLFDAESRNGTIVNGAPVQKARLADGDEIQVCGCTLRFTQNGSGAINVRNPAAATTPDEFQLPTRDAPRPPTQPTMTPIDTGQMLVPTTSAYQDAIPSLAPIAATHPTYRIGDTTDLRSDAGGSDGVGGMPLDHYVTVEAVPQIRRRSAAPAFFVGLLLALLGGGGVYAAYLVNEPVGREDTVATGDVPKTDPRAGAFGPGNPLPDRGGENRDPAGEGTGTDPTEKDPDGLIPNAAVVDGGAGGVGANPALAKRDGEEPLVGDDPTGNPNAEAPDDDEPSASADGESDDENAAEVAAAAQKIADAKRRVKRPRTKSPTTTEPVAATDDEEEEADEEATGDDEPAVVASTTATTAPTPTASAKWFPAEIVASPRVAVRVVGGGKVKSIDVKDGDAVSEGATLVTFDVSIDAADMATLKESIRALEAIVESGGSAEADNLLKQEQERLARLEQGASSSKVTAPTSGTVTSFTVTVGERVRSKQVIGFIQGAKSNTLTATVDKDAAAKVKKGSKVGVRTPMGDASEGTVVSTKKKGTKVIVTVVVSDVDAADVDSIRIP